MRNERLRQCLVELLSGGSAHVRPERVLEGVARENRARRPAENIRSIWEELEHMRLAQEDILNYTLDPSWTSPEWPTGYWPAQTTSVSDQAWERSVGAFQKGLARVVELVNDRTIDPTAEIPHAEEGHTYLREVLLAADHNAYHLGQIVQLRKLFGDWHER